MLTVKQLAKRLQISRTKAYRIVEAGEIAHQKFGSAVRVTEEQFAEYLASTLRPTKKSRTPRPNKPRRSYPELDYFVSRRRQ